jgi:hypothetical protein
VSLDFAAIETALVSWVMLGTGLDSAHVILEDAGHRPADEPYAVIHIGDERQIGQDEVTQSANYLVFADVTITAVSPAANTLTKTAHGLLTGDGPVRLTTTGGAPGGLAVATDYWVIRLDADTVQLAATFEASLALTPIDITSAGTGTHAIVDTPTTRRVGQEVLREHTAPCELDVEIQIVGGSNVGNATSRALASTLRKRGERLLAMRAILEGANVSVLRWQPARNLLPTRQLVTFEPRTVLSLVLSCSNYESELCGIVERVFGTFEIEGLP